MAQVQMASRPTTTSLRTGADYLRSLNDGRQVFVNGERVCSEFSANNSDLTELSFVLCEGMAYQCRRPKVLRCCNV